LPEIAFSSRWQQHLDLARSPAFHDRLPSSSGPQPGSSACSAAADIVRAAGRQSAYTDRKEFRTIDDTIRWLGVLLFAASGALRIWSVFVLGHRFSGLAAIQPGHELVTSGVYRVIRHPGYLGLLVNSLGWALAFRSAVGVLLTALLLAPLLARIRAEERMLRTQFGDEYDACRSRTSRLLPGIY
jgi:protein-S-isoprenylcysteine O-methyltransferase Ste14